MSCAQPTAIANAVADAKHVARIDADPKLPLTVYMHVMGGAGFVAYGGLIEIGRMKAGEQVFVSTAAGSVGSLASQIAKLKGCTVIGSTGSDDKVSWLSLGLDAVINTEGADPRGAGKSDAKGHRRLFRQCRRRTSGSRAAPHEHA